MYLTFEEYQQLPFHNSDLLSVEFDKKIPLASLVLDEITRSYYQLNDINADTDELRVNRFKQALGIQIDYLFAQGIDSSVDAGNSIQSVSMGRTSVTFNKETTVNYNSVVSDLSSIYAPELRSILNRTGLLYRGVSQ